MRPRRASGMSYALNYSISFTKFTVQPILRDRFCCISRRRFSSDLKVCVVGSGPAGYYTAQKLLKGSSRFVIDIIDKIPVPFGLVRFGVAPDHPEVKNVIHSFTQVTKRFSDRLRFFGNVELGKDVEIGTLKSIYDIVILSYGAENDRSLSILGEDAYGVYSAKEIVGWYNGLPNHASLLPRLDTDAAVIIGQGNVALDIGRILLMPVDELAKTDICNHALEHLVSSQIKRVYIVGRRGPLQTAFTIKELRELINLKGIKSYVCNDELQGIDLNVLPRPKRRLTELMLTIASKEKMKNEDPNLKSWHLKFLRTPKEIITEGNAVTGVRFIHNKLQGESIDRQKAVVTDATSIIQCGLVIRSIGYQSLPLAEADQLPFDKTKNTIPNVKGRVLGCPGIYCSGWVKRGPVGVIANTMLDAFETADSVLEDIENGKISVGSTKSYDLLTYLSQKGIQSVTFSEWEKIDAEEIRRGQSKNKPREKIVRKDEMITIAKS